MTNSTRPPAANDNRAPRYADSFANNADRRAWLATLPTDFDEVLAWPALERLAYRRDDLRMVALRHWRNLASQVSHHHEQVSEDDLSVEGLIEERPSEGELLRAVGWKVVGKECWSWTGKNVNRYEKNGEPAYRPVTVEGHEIVTYGTLVFRDGRLVEWGRTKKGRALRVVTKVRSRQAVAQASLTAAAARHTDLRPTRSSPLQTTSLLRPVSAAKVLNVKIDPLPAIVPNEKDRIGRFGVQEARAILSFLRVDGRVRLEDLSYPVTRLPDGVAAGAEFFGIIKQLRGSRGAPISHHSASLARRAAIQSARKILGAHAAVLDMAITNATAKEIGVTMGFAPAYAEKRGARLIEAALDQFEAIQQASNDNVEVDQQKLAA